MATATLSISPWLSTGGSFRTAPPMALLAGSSRMPNTVSLRSSTSPRPALLTCSFMPSSSSLCSSFSGLSLGLNLRTSSGIGNDRCRRLVVRAGKAALCLTKRNRSNKSLARTHGFRKRMMTTSGRALLKRRRAKGRKVLCTQSNPNSGKPVVKRGLRRR